MVADFSALVDSASKLDGAAPLACEGVAAPGGWDRGALGPEFCGVFTTIGLRMVDCGEAGAACASGAVACCASAGPDAISTQIGAPMHARNASADTPPASLLTMFLCICPVPLVTSSRLQWLAG